MGLERTAAVEAMNQFLNNTTATSTQLEFVHLIVDELTKHGAMASERLYQSPFTDLTATGPDAIFPTATVTELFKTIEDIRLRAVA